MPKSTLKPVEGLSYEQALAELEALVSVLEEEQKPLDEAIALFERGQALTRYCTDLLEKAQLRVQQLNGQDVQDLETEE
jgi:exodeoxyribonuclease VII small subunit